MLGLLSESKGTVVVVALWGQTPGRRMDVEAFGPDQCWALRRGRPHAVGGGESALLCGHLHAAPRTPYVCVPMMAAGHPLGVLHVQPAPRDARRDLSRAADAVESLQRLAESAAGQVALTLANLRLQETLRGQAIHDPLTGLFNRRYMEESLDRELQRAARIGTSLGLILMDIDHFKRFNDSFGHEAGDLLLAALGNLLRTLVREEDIVCRYGGEEFTAIFPGASLEATIQRAEEIRDGVRRLTVPSEHGELGSITLSLGVAAYPEHGLSSRKLLAAADAALYRAKEEGRDRPAVAAPASGQD
jgi:diguanylate cyclase (GGDEF)-like protein